MMAKTGSASSAPEHENKGNDMATKAEIRAADNRAEASEQMKARVSFLEAAVEWARAERDTAIRERDTLRAERITQALTADRFAAAVREADKLRARVAELESQLESVADRAATAETALEAAPAAGTEAMRELRDAAVCLPHCGGERLQRAIAAAERLLTQPLPAIPASDAAGTGHVLSEVLAWGVMVDREAEVLCVPFTVREAADHFVRLNGVNESLRVVPLYAAAPASPGWLTPTEREAIMYLIANRSQFAPQTPHEERRNAASRVCHDLLARSTPPEVVMPSVYQRSSLGDSLVALEQVKAALAAAGVPWKEVGRE